MPHQIRPLPPTYDRQFAIKIIGCDRMLFECNAGGHRYYVEMSEYLHPRSKAPALLAAFLKAWSREQGGLCEQCPICRKILTKATLEERRIR